MRDMINYEFRIVCSRCLVAPKSQTLNISLPLNFFGLLKGEKNGRSGSRGLEYNNNKPGDGILSDKG